MAFKAPHGLTPPSASLHSHHALSSLAASTPVPRRLCVLFLLPKVSFCCSFTQEADSPCKACQLKDPSWEKPFRAATDPHFSGLLHSRASYPGVQKPLDIVSQNLGAYVQGLFSGHMSIVFAIFSKGYKSRIGVWLGIQAVKSDGPRFTIQLPLHSCAALDKLLNNSEPHSSPL